MGKCSLSLIFVILCYAIALARPVDGFLVEDGQGSYPFTLAATEMKLFFFSYQNESYADMRNRVFTYIPTGHAPLDSSVAREEIAKAVKWLFFNERGRMDTAHPVELSGGIVCYPMVLIADGSSSDGLGMHVVVEAGAIRKVEVAACMNCSLMATHVKDYESRKSKVRE